MQNTFGYGLTREQAEAVEVIKDANHGNVIVNAGLINRPARVHVIGVGVYTITPEGETSYTPSARHHANH